MSERSSTPEAVNSSYVKGKQRSLLSQIREISEENSRYFLNPGEGLDHAYIVYGTNIFGYNGYQKDFNKILDGERIVDFVNERPFPVVIDFMGPSDTIASIFRWLPPGKTKMGLAISLQDRRNEDLVKRDEELNIQQLAGNIMEASTWRRINDALQGRKADLIMERAAGGLQNIPVYEKTYAIMLNKAWQMLSNQNGMLLVEVPREDVLQDYNIRIREWIEYLKEKGIDAIYVSGNDIYEMDNSGSIKLIKTPNSPKDLPFLKIPGNLNLDQTPTV